LEEYLPFVIIKGGVNLEFGINSNFESSLIGEIGDIEEEVGEVEEFIEFGDIGEVINGESVEELEEVGEFKLTIPTISDFKLLQVLTLLGPLINLLFNDDVLGVTLFIISSLESGEYFDKVGEDGILE
ncbi:15665_t:CDS:2, partial [Dentiscutata erythropus]